jgi:chromosome segregation ATPase
MTGDFYRGTLSAKEMSELKTILASVLAKLHKLDRLNKLENKLEASNRESKERYETSKRESKERHEALQSKLETCDRESKERHEALQSKLETCDRESKERYENLQNKLDKLESSHRELKESNGQLQKDIEIKLENLQENIKTVLKTETEKLIQRFDLASENQGIEV